MYNIILVGYSFFLSDISHPGNSVPDNLILDNSILVQLGTSLNVAYSSKLHNSSNKRYFMRLVGRVLTNDPGDLGSIPGRVIPKTKKKMGLDTFLLNTQQYKVRIKGKGEQSNTYFTISYFKVCHLWGRSVMAKVLNCGYKFSHDFELQSRSCIHFWTNASGKSMNHLIHPNNFPSQKTRSIWVRNVITVFVYIVCCIQQFHLFPLLS